MPLLAGCVAVALVLSIWPAAVQAAEQVQFVAPFAESIQESLFNGVLGPEWDDAGWYEVVLGRYEATIFLKHDAVYLYIGFLVSTGRRFPNSFECYIVFDNGDGRDYSRGDDMLLAAAGQGLAPADYYYRDVYDFHPDSSSNACGIGVYNSSERQYEFEFRREISSGDPDDVALEIDRWVTAIYGWASY